ncbi:putative ribonuclease H-like domain-containing protein, partial [Tanacetum coccineum]
DIDNGEPKTADDAQKQVKDGQNNENAEQDEFSDNSSTKDVNAAGQHVNTASPDVNTGSLKLNDVGSSVNTASSNEHYSPKDMFTMGVSPTLKATHIEFFSDEDEPEVDLGNITNSYIVPTTPNIRIHKDHPIDIVIGDVKSSVQTRRMTKPTYEQKFLSDVYEQKTHDTLNTCLYACFLSQIEPTSIAKAHLIHPGWKQCRKNFCNSNFNKFGYWWICLMERRPLEQNRQEEGIDYEEVFAHVARIKAIRLFLAYASFMGNSGISNGCSQGTLWFASSTKSMVYVDDIIFGSTNKELCTGFEKLMKDKFQMSSLGELTFFLGLKVQQKEDGIFISHDKYVAEILKKFNYSDVKSMIGSLMYLTASRSDIMFAVCACARFQVTPKTSHLLVVKRIFRYLKGKPTLGLWYSRDSPFELVAYTDSDYARATQDRKSTTGGCQFLGNRLISW